MRVIKYFCQGAAKFLLLLFFFAAVQYASADELKPRNVVVRSSFTEKIKVPKIETHLFNPLPPDQIQEPYLPDFDFEAVGLPQDFPQNLVFNWLTTFSPSLSRLFRGNTGRLENGIYFYQLNKLIQAESDLFPLLTEQKEHRERATLYMAWIKFKERLWNESIKLTAKLENSNNLEIVKEALYLKSLIFLYRKQYLKVTSLYEEQKSHLDLERLDLKQIYVYLTSLAKLGYWKEAQTVSVHVMNRPIAYTKSYYKIIELCALIDYERKNYRDSLEKFSMAAQYNSHPAFQYAMYRRIAWQYYIIGDFQGAIEALGKQNSRFTFTDIEELFYLKLACYVQQKKWKRVQEILNRLDPSSVFYTYASFQIRSYLKSPSSHPILFRQVSQQQFNFPEMKFHVAVLDGNLFFEKSQYQKARNAYLRALSVDSNSPDYWKAQFNLGLTRLKLHQYSQAEEDFLHLLRASQETYYRQIRYQLAYTQYQLSKPEETLQTVESANIPSYDKTQQIELLMIKGGSLLRIRQPDKARRIFEEIQSRSNQTESLEFIAKIHYDKRQFDQVLSLIESNPEQLTDTLVIYQIKSLLALRRFNKAQVIIDQIDGESEIYIDLRLKVWAANQKYQDIIKYISKRLRSSLTMEKRRQYYLELGNAYFNLRQYRESKNHFFRALNLTKTPAQKSLVLYNIALSSYYYKDYTSFLREVNQVLSRKQISQEVRYNLTLLLSEYYQKSKNIAQADKVFREHYQLYSYNQANIHVKRVRLWFQNAAYEKCVHLGRIKVKTESLFQRRDRLVMFGYCANHLQHPNEVIKAIQNEVKQHKSEYRINELNFVLAQAYSHAGDFNRSMSLSRSLVGQPLNPKVQQENQLLITHNLLQVKKPAKAQSELGDVNQYRSTGQYVRSLQLLSEIEFQQRQHHRAHRTLLRIFYLPSSSEPTRHLALLRLVEGYLHEGSPKSAMKHFKMIDMAAISKTPNGKKRYQAAGKAIRKLKAGS